MSEDMPRTNMPHKPTPIGSSIAIAMVFVVIGIIVKSMFSGERIDHSKIHESIKLGCYEKCYSIQDRKD